MLWLLKVKWSFVYSWFDKALVYLILWLKHRYIWFFDVLKFWSFTIHTKSSGFTFWKWWQGARFRKSLTNSASRLLRLELWIPSLYKLALFWSHLLSYFETRCISRYSFSERSKFAVVKINKNASKNFNEEEHLQSEKSYSPPIINIFWKCIFL